MQIPLTNITRIQGGGTYAAALIGGRLKAWGLNAAVSPPDVGVFNTTHNYTTGYPVDVPQVPDDPQLHACVNAAFVDARFDSPGDVDQAIVWPVPLAPPTRAAP